MKKILLMIGSTIAFSMVSFAQSNNLEKISNEFKQEIYKQLDQIENNYEYNYKLSNYTDEYVWKLGNMEVYLETESACYTTCRKLQNDFLNAASNAILKVMNKYDAPKNVKTYLKQEAKKQFSNVSCNCTKIQNPNYQQEEIQDNPNIYPQLHNEDGSASMAEYLTKYAFKESNIEIVEKDNSADKSSEDIFKGINPVKESRGISYEDLKKSVDVKNESIIAQNEKEFEEIGIISKEFLRDFPIEKCVIKSYIHHLNSLIEAENTINKIWEATMEEAVNNMQGVGIDAAVDIIEGYATKSVSLIASEDLKNSFRFITPHLQKSYEKQRYTYAKYSSKFLRSKIKIADNEDNIAIASEKSLKLSLNLMVDLAKGGAKVGRFTPWAEIVLKGGELMIYYSVYSYAQDKKEQNVFDKAMIENDISICKNKLEIALGIFNCLEKNDNQNMVVFGKNVRKNGCLDLFGNNISGMKKAITGIYEWKNEIEDLRMFSIERSRNSFKQGNCNRD